MPGSLAKTWSRSGALELLQKICGQSWAIFLGTFGAKQSAVAGEGDGLSSKASIEAKRRLVVSLEATASS